jgi:uncharacterized membrane protein YwzB
MFNQNVGDGANTFMIIVAVIVGFVHALAYVDYLRTKKNQEKHD